MNVTVNDLSKMADAFKEAGKLAEGDSLPFAALLNHR
jgi:hypothetical protein